MPACTCQNLVLWRLCLPEEQPPSPRDFPREVTQNVKVKKADESVEPQVLKHVETTGQNDPKGLVLGVLGHSG